MARWTLTGMPLAATHRRNAPISSSGGLRAIRTRKPSAPQYVEWNNLIMRMSIRRFTRLTNAFSKKVENHTYSIALHFMHYNFCRIHGSLRVSPAMAAA